MRDQENTVSLWILLVLLTVVIAAWAINGFIFYYDTQRGTFGDMFGSVNALFTGLAFAGIIYTIFLQRKDIELQRRELELTREELEGQKEQLKAQNDTLRKQAFESTFFQLIGLHNDIVKTIAVRSSDGGKVLTGREGFRRYREVLRDYYERAQKENAGQSGELEKIDSSYKMFFEGHQAELGHYFRNLYNLIKFVKNSEIGDKKVFTNIVRSQLSSYELFILFYDCLSEYGRYKFKPLVEEFSLLNNLPKNLVFDSSHLKLFDGSAYASSD